MAFGLGRALTTHLAVLNFILYLISACLAGWALNRYIDSGSSGVFGYSSGIGNGATGYFLLFALIASVVGLASVLAGAHHLTVWRTDSIAASHAAAVIAWLLTLLAFGLACKEIHIGGSRSKRLKTLEAFIIILAFFQLLYLLSLHAGILGSNYGPTYGAAAPGTGVGPKTPNVGTPAASAV
ncbi:unnamed protein product [Sphagnum jensenii]|uniref:Uncharacterized protein n=1 Tax=Sphagnum jensenii TaxID=128206 RepID=A0ABP0W523_9BRYO